MKADKKEYERNYKKHLESFGLKKVDGIFMPAGRVDGFRAIRNVLRDCSEPQFKAILDMAKSFNQAENKDA